MVSGRAVPLRRSDVDTDQIIPAEWLKRVERTGFEKGLFSTWRDDRDFVLNDERFAGAESCWSAGRTSASARRASTPCGRIQQLRLRRGDLAPLRRHLPQQLHQERPRARGAAAPRWSSGSWTRSRPTPPRGHRRRRAARRRGARARHRRAVPPRPADVQHRFVEASTTSASRSAHADHIAAFERRAPGLAAVGRPARIDKGGPHWHPGRR